MVLLAIVHSDMRVFCYSGIQSVFHTGLSICLIPRPESPGEPQEAREIQVRERGSPQFKFGEGDLNGLLGSPESNVGPSKGAAQFTAVR